MPDLVPAAQRRRPHRFGRRSLLGAAAGGALALALGPGLRRQRLASALAAAKPTAAKPAAFKQRLRIPPVLTDADVAIEMRQAKVAVVPGKKTKMWTYGGTFPGPTIRRPAGERTQVTFTHRLPKEAGELTVHLHGGHNAASEDGQPGGLTATQDRALYCDLSPATSARAAGNDLLIGPGGSRTYTYDLVEDGAPERAAFQWYHDHRFERTGRNVWRGLAGMMIVDDAFDAALPLPRGERDIPLMLADRSLTKRNQLTNPFGPFASAPDDGVSGELILVNGVHRPYHRVSATRHRLRILNASNFRSYNLELKGARMTQIATESGLMPAPVPRKKILVGPGERVEVIAEFGAAAGRRVVLRSVKRSDGPKTLGSTAFVGDLMEFRVGRKAEDTTSVPGTLRPLPDWVAAAPQSPSKTWEFTVSTGLRPTWLVNGQTFDPERSEAFPKLGTTETWRLSNKTAVAHMIHLHANDWYMLSRNGKPPPPWEDCLKETFFMDPDEEVVVAGRFSDHLGKFVVHCHMLDHEDHGLMSQFEVVPGDSPG